MLSGEKGAVLRAIPWGLRHTLPGWPLGATARPRPGASAPRHSRGIPASRCCHRQEPGTAGPARSHADRARGVALWRRAASLSGSAAVFGWASAAKEPTGEARPQPRGWWSGVAMGGRVRCRIDGAGSLGDDARSRPGRNEGLAIIRLQSGCALLMAPLLPRHR